MRLDALLFKITFDGCRQHERVGLALPGRYMLPDAREFACSTIDVSAGGIAFRSDEKGRVGEQIVAYVSELGRIEGAIVRPLNDGFAVRVTASTRKSEKLAARIGWLAEHRIFGAPDNRRRGRLDLADAHTTLETAEGALYPAKLVDISYEGASIEVEAAPPVGATVSVGRTMALVVRHFPGGVAVTFLAPGQSPNLAPKASIESRALAALAPAG